MLLNCDLGEGMAYDEQIIPLIDMANLACGAHAGSPEIMRANVIRAKEHDIAMGAHPGYPDRENFGRVSIPMEAQKIKTEITEQISLLDGICRSENTHISYVKPHGALYNDMMRDDTLFETIVKTIAEYDKKLKLMILSTPENIKYRNTADQYGIGLLYEIFADRNYTDDGHLVPRSRSDAVIHDVDEVVERIRSYRDSGVLLSAHGKPLSIECDTVCVHGDNEESLRTVKALRAMLGEK